MGALVLIRHAETAMAGRFCGDSDPPLNAAGEAQLASIVEQLASLDIARIVSSDLRRAMQTANAIGERIGIHVEPRRNLREIHFGEWEGLNWLEIEQRFPLESQSWLREFPWRSAPSGERYEEFAARVQSEFVHLLSVRENSGIAVVTHRGVMQYVLTNFLGFEQSVVSHRCTPYGAIFVASGEDFRSLDSKSMYAIVNEGREA